MCYAFLPPPLAKKELLCHQRLTVLAKLCVQCTILGEVSFLVNHSTIKLI